mgnify:CR=1 FL=1
MNLKYNRPGSLIDQRGSAVVLVALGMVLLLGAVALTTDGGYLYLQRQKLVNTVDAAALAAAHELPDQPSAAVSTAYDYASRNGCAADEIAVTVAPGNRQIQVTATRQVPLFFARVLGRSSSQVAATATAAISPVSAMSGIAPLSVAEQPFIFGLEYQLKDSPSEISDPAHGSGWYGPLSLGGGGADNYLNSLKHGYSGKLKVGDIVNTETGNMDEPTSIGIAYRVSSCHHSPACSISQFDPGCPRVLLIPVVHPLLDDKNQVKQVQVVGFASFLVDGFVGAGKDSYIRGRFVQMVAAGETGPEQMDYGLNIVRLLN